MVRTDRNLNAGRRPRRLLQHNPWPVRAGAGMRNRTPNILSTKQMLYRLSYTCVFGFPLRLSHMGRCCVSTVITITLGLIRRFQVCFFRYHAVFSERYYYWFSHAVRSEIVRALPDIWCCHQELNLRHAIISRALYH